MGNLLNYEWDYVINTELSEEQRRVGGSFANYAGQKLEEIVDKYCAKHFGAEIVDFKEWAERYSRNVNRLFTEDSNKRYVIKQYPYRRIDGRLGRSDSVLDLGVGDLIKIESRSQSTSGSADDKLPTLLEHCAIWKGDTSIMVIEGKGHSPAMIELIKVRARAIKNKNVFVFNFEEFTEWVRTLVRGEVA